MVSADRMRIARAKTGEVFASHSAPLASGKVEWFIVQPDTGLLGAVHRLRAAGRVVVAITPSPKRNRCYVDVLEPDDA